MTTIQISYNEKNAMAKKTIDFLLSLGIFKVHEVVESSAKKKTLKAIESVKKGEFHVYAISTIEEGTEILTNVPAGKRDKNVLILLDSTKKI